MATTSDIKQRANTLAQKKAPNSITPEEVGGLFYDLAEAVEDNGQDGGVGQATEEGGEVFNNYVDNEAASLSHAEGDSTMASGRKSHAEGETTVSGGVASHAEGSGTTANGDYSHAEGFSTDANANCSHAEGYRTKTTNDYEHAEGVYNWSETSTLDNKKTRFSIGIGTVEGGRKNAMEIKANGDIYVYGIGKYEGFINGFPQTLQQIINGSINTAVGKEDITGNHAEIFNDYDVNRAYGDYAHAEGGSTTAQGHYSHSEGYMCKAQGHYSHAEGTQTLANAEGAHSEGFAGKARSKYSHVEGERTETTNPSEHAEGSFNVSNPGTRHSIGIGIYENKEEKRKNAFEVMDDGRAYFYGIGGYDGTNTETEGVQTIQEVIDSLMQKIQEFSGTE